MLTDQFEPRDGAAAKPRTPPDAFLSFRLAAVSGRLARILGETLQDKHGVQISEWRILEVLDEHGPLCGYALAALTDMDKARVSRSARRLSDLGWVHLNRDAEDGRKISLQLSLSGRARIGAMRREVIASEKKFLMRLNAAERASLETLLAALVDPLPSEGDI